MLTRWEKIEDNKVKLEVEVPVPEVETALARAYRKVATKVSLPGFRKGKVPRRILESRFGPEVLHEDALEILVPPAYEQAIQEADLEPIEQPDIELVQFEEGKPLLFSAMVEVLPEVELGEYKGLAVEQEDIAVTDEQVDQHLEDLREQHARLVPLEEGAAAQNGHLVQIDFQGFIDGEPFSGGEAENYSLELGAGAFIPGFEEQLIGAVTGDEREVTVTFPEDYRKEELAGKEALFKVTVKQIKEKQLPELDDDFVKEAGDKETLAEFRTEIRERMEQANQERAKVKLEETLIEKLSDASQVQLPDVLVERQIDRMLGDMEQYLRYQGLTMEKFVELSGKDMKDMREEKRDEAAKRAKANLVLDALVKKEGIEVTESEIDDKIAEIAAAHNEETARVKELFEKQGRVNVMREEIRIRKAIDLLVAGARVNMVKPAE
jgi:trigger factor